MVLSLNCNQTSGDKDKNSLCIIMIGVPLIACKQFRLLTDHESGAGSYMLALAYLEFLHSCWSEVCMLHPLRVEMGVQGCQSVK